MRIMAGDFVWMAEVSLLFFTFLFFYICFHYIAYNKLFHDNGKLRFIFQ